MRSGGTKVKVEEGFLEMRAIEMAEATSKIAIIGLPSTAISVLVRSVKFQQGMRGAGVDGRHDLKVIQSVSVFW